MWLSTCHSLVISTIISNNLLIINLLTSNSNVENVDISKIDNRTVTYQLYLDNQIVTSIIMTMLKI